MLQVGGLREAGESTGTKGARKKQLNSPSDVWTSCIVPFDSDDAVSTSSTGHPEKLKIPQYVKREMTRNRWLPEQSLQPASPLFPVYEALVASLEGMHHFVRVHI